MDICHKNERCVKCKVTFQTLFLLEILDLALSTDLVLLPANVCLLYLVANIEVRIIPVDRIKPEGVISSDKVCLTKPAFLIKYLCI